MQTTKQYVFLFEKIFYGITEPRKNVKDTYLIRTDMLPQNAWVHNISTGDAINIFICPWYIHKFVAVWFEVNYMFCSPLNTLDYN